MPHLSDPGQNGQPLCFDPQKDTISTRAKRTNFWPIAHARAREAVHHRHHGPLGRGVATQAPPRTGVGTIDYQPRRGGARHGYPYRRRDVSTGARRGRWRCPQPTQAA